MQAAVAKGDFQIALLPISASASDPLALLQQMARQAPGGWADAAFAAACAAEEENYRLSGRAKRLAALERELILACPVAPLYHEAQYLLADPAVSTYVYDGSLVMGNLMNAAHAVGVDSCYIFRAKEVFATEEGKAMLRSWGIPDHFEGIGNCILGYRDEGGVKPVSPRKENYIVRV